MTTFKPGDIVRHPERAELGIIDCDGEIFCVKRDPAANSDYYNTYLDDPTGWERVEACTVDERRVLDSFQDVREGRATARVYGSTVIANATAPDCEIVLPGHVQVRVDDLDLSDWAKKDETGVIPYGRLGKLAVRAAEAIAAQTGIPESHKESQKPEDLTDSGVAPNLTPTDEQPASATITLTCGRCGETFGGGLHVMAGDGDWKAITWDEGRAPTHTCPPAQPDEPTDFGARVTVTRPDGTREPWLRCVAGPMPWASEAQQLPHSWDELTEDGAITLGWDNS